MPDYVFDASRARLRDPDMFMRFRVPGEGTPLHDLGWEADEDILVIERGGRRLAFLVNQMTYHHVAQGRLAGHPYVISF